MTGTKGEMWMTQQKHNSLALLLGLPSAMFWRLRCEFCWMVRQEVSKLLETSHSGEEWFTYVDGNEPASRRYQ